MGFFEFIAWVFNFIFVFGLYFAATAGSIVIVNRINRKKMILCISAGIILCIPVILYFHSEFVQSYRGTAVYGLFTFAKITWRIDMLYTMLAGDLVFGIAYAASKWNKTAFLAIASISLALFFSGLFQALIGLFFSHEYFEYIGAHLYY